MSHSGMQTLTISPDTWFCTVAPLRPLRRRGSSPAEGSSFSSTPRPPPLGRPSSSLLPSLEGESFLVPPPRFHERRALRTHQTTSPTPPCCGNSFESRWFSSSWPSSPAPRKVPELAASPRGLGLGLRAGEPDS